MTDNDTATDAVTERNFLIWEGNEIPAPETRRGFHPEPSQYITEFNTVPFLMPAKDEHEACMKVARKTRRLSKYAVCPVTFIDFTTVFDAEPVAEPGRLTP